MEGADSGLEGMGTKKKKMPSFSQLPWYPAVPPGMSCLKKLHVFMAKSSATRDRREWMGPGVARDGEGNRMWHFTSKTSVGSDSKSLT